MHCSVYKYIAVFINTLMSMQMRLSNNKYVAVFINALQYLYIR